MSELEEVAGFVPGLDPLDRHLDWQEESRDTLVADAEYAVFDGSVTGQGLEMSATVVARSDDAARRVAPALSRVLGGFAKTLGYESTLDGEKSRELSKQIAAFVASMQVATEGRTVTIKAIASPKMVELLCVGAVIAP